MTTAQSLIRQCRQTSGLTQRELADRAGTHQPAVATVESGARDAKVETLARLIAGAGGRLTVLPTTTPTVADTAELIASEPAGPHDERVLRHLIGLSDALAAQEPALRVALCVTPPHTGSARFDAALAALVELRLVGLPLPGWVNDADTGGLDDPWIVTRFVDRDELESSTPEPFRRRGVLIAADEFASV